MKAFPGAPKIFTPKTLNNFYESDSNTCTSFSPGLSLLYHIMLMWFGVMVTKKSILSKVYFPGELKKTLLNVYSRSRLTFSRQCPIYIPRENFRKPKVFWRFHGVWKWDIEVKRVNSAWYFWQVILCLILSIANCQTFFASVVAHSTFH